MYIAKKMLRIVTLIIKKFCERNDDPLSNFIGNLVWRTDRTLKASATNNNVNIIAKNAISFFIPIDL